MSRDDEALDFMTEHEIAEILATEELLEVDMDTFDEDLLDEDVATDSDNEQQLDSPRWCQACAGSIPAVGTKCIKLIHFN